MKLAPGSPLSMSLVFDQSMPALNAGRLAMDGARAQLEWSRDVVDARLNVSALRYPPEPGLQAARSTEFEGLHGFLADSLPEGWGYIVMRRRLAGLGVRIEDLSPLDRLALVGRRGRGALVYAPETTPDGAAAALDLDTLATESAAILAGDESDLIEALARVAGGSGGARPKANLWLDDDGSAFVGDDDRETGRQAWIVKFRATNDPVDIGPIEAAYAAMAQAAGLLVAEHRLLPARAGPDYFATRRFDRPEAGARLHMVSLSGALEAPADRSPIGYDQFLRAIMAITRDSPSATEGFGRMVFNVLAGNRDDHTRQHAFLMDAAGRWRLSPAFDLTPSSGPGGEHYMDVDGEGRNPTRTHVGRLGRVHGLTDKVVAGIVDRTMDAVGGWNRFANEAGVTRASREEIAERHTQIRKAFD